jgi:6-pyruvoyl-tetrahydropterin synthase
MIYKINITDNEISRVKILVCYYQPWHFPTESIFFPIQAGKAVSSFKLKIQGDDTGDNISEKNATFSEFTAWYWGWKNIKTIYPNIEYIGLSHYRRFFALDRPYEGYTLLDRYRLPNMEDYESLIIKKLDNNDIILARPASFEVNLQTQYAINHHISDFYCMKDIIHEICPEYDNSFLHFFENNNTLSLYCMFIARYELFQQYFEWLFPLLFEAERRLDFSKHNAYQKRVIAFLAERLLNIYVRHHKLKVLYQPIFFLTDGKKITEPGISIITLLKRIIKFIMPYGILKYYKIKYEKKMDIECEKKSKKK